MLVHVRIENQQNDDSKINKRKIHDIDYLRHTFVDDGGSLLE
jgi:hypothetical protein